MALRSSNSFDFSDVVHEYLRAYEGLTAEALTTVIPQVAKEAAKRLRADSPEGRTGRYRKGWTYKVETGIINKGAVVYGNKPTYRLAHLLEYGHLSRKGVRVGQREHIKKVEEWAIDEAINRFIDYMEGHTI